MGGERRASALPRRVLRASRLEWARPRRSHLWPAGAARCHVRGSRRSSEPTSWERSDGPGWQRWFQSGGASAAQRSARLYAGQGARQARRRCRSSAPRLAVVLRLVAAFVVVIVHVQPLVRRARPCARCPRGGRLDRFAPPMPVVLRVSAPVAGGLTDCLSTGSHRSCSACRPGAGRRGSAPCRPP
jgi:hypothetical protein